MKNHKYITKEIAEQLIDFSGGNDELKALGQMQLEGAVALYNKLIRNGVGYLADEVGMGKTYVALGVVCLLRYFNPSLRVLYILPKHNILTKWKDTDFTNFLKFNFKVANYKVKTSEHAPSSPQVYCENLESLIRHSASGFYGDYFIKMSSFSFGLSDDETTIQTRLDHLKSLIPAYSGITDSIHKKQDVKTEYARTINAILPHFDLVLIDEAHNFRKGFGIDASDRNRILSIILGTNMDEANLIRRVDTALLLSATPYQHSINELQNQLEIVGYDLKRFTQDKSIPTNNDAIKNTLKKFVVRRLNIIHINGSDHTRNMYREEFRDKTIEFSTGDVRQKLIVALVQKKIGELIHNMKGQYQTGMLASFESYIPGTKKIDVEFDGDDKNRCEASDNSIITVLTDSYAKTFGEKTLPHPKMDKTVDEYGKKAFNNGEKHLIFVRRIWSVRDLKRKFDQLYDNWLYNYFRENIQDVQIKKEFLAIFDSFKTSKYEEVVPITANSSNDEDEIDQELKPALNNFFTYYFRGSFEGEKGNFVRPKTFRSYLLDPKKSSIADSFKADGIFFDRLDVLYGHNIKKMNDFKKELIFSMLRYGHGFIDLYISYLNGKEYFIDNFFKLLLLQKNNHEKFSTYSQLHDLIENIDIVIKTTFPKWEKQGKTPREYIRAQISPLEPISGSIGGDDKSAIARKFRMPGYPMILISTDVLQEGEDLHTFCDSVIHYGLSSTPISIEQKTGRVDRVGSLAQRRLMNMKNGINIATDGIKVAFPHIKESIERVQVRSIAENLNRFLTSLNDFDTKHPSVEYQREEDLANKSPIPPLIKAYLKSPYVVDQDDLEPEEICEIINTKADAEYIEHIKTYIEKLISIPKLNYDDNKPRFGYELSAAMNPYELVLRIKTSHVTHIPNDLEGVRKQMIFSLNNYNRTYCTNNVLRYDAHTLVGDELLTQASEIDELITRAQNGYCTTLDKTIIELNNLFDASLLKRELFVRNHIVDAQLVDNLITFTFCNGSDIYKYKRTQKVTVTQDEGYIIFTSKAGIWSQWNQEGIKKLIEYTWERNAMIDIVEFLLNSDDEIIGRIVHPANSIQSKELMYFSYILACEADHLEQIINDFGLGDRF
jgi:hypothetical protein